MVIFRSEEPKWMNVEELYELGKNEELFQR